MTNYEGIIRMTQDELETFLEQVHLRGLITGGYAVRMGFDWELEANPFHAAWLAETAESAVDGSNAPYLKALSDAIGRLLAEAVQDEKVSSSIMPPRSMQKYRWKQPEDTGKDLWNEWITQELLLMQQQASTFYAMKQMVNAVLQGEITDPDEIDDILLELSVFRDCHAPAEALWQEVCQQIVQHHPIFWQFDGSGLVRAIFEEYKEGVDTNDN